MLDTKLLKKKEKFDQFSETFVMFITENDVMRRDLPLYHFDRRCEETGEYLGDEAHIIFVNGAYENPNDSIGRLMHDFKCVHADDMYNSELIERFRHFKETEGGMSEMCKLIEDRLNEEKIDAIKALLMLGKLTREEIANSLNVSIELVDNVANGKVA